MPGKDRKGGKSLGSPFANVSAEPWHVGLPEPGDSGMFIEPPRGLIALVALTVTVFFRKDFGERYLTTTTIPKGMFILSVYLVAIRFLAGGAAPVSTATWSVWLAFALAFMTYVSWQLFRSLRRMDQFSDEFSKSDGRPWTIVYRIMPAIRGPWDFERFYEPAICIIAGAVLWYHHNLFGPYLILAGCCAFYTAKTKHYARRMLELDKLDGMLESQVQPNFDQERESPPATPVQTNFPQDPNGGRR